MPILVLMWSAPFLQIAGTDTRNQEMITRLACVEDASTKAALTERSSDHGLTLLGQAVAWGFIETVTILLAGCWCVHTIELLWTCDAKVQPQPPRQNYLLE